jgi:hypothetical protein
LFVHITECHNVHIKLRKAKQLMSELNYKLISAVHV